MPVATGTTKYENRRASFARTPAEEGGRVECAAPPKAAQHSPCFRPRGGVPGGLFSKQWQFRGKALSRSGCCSNAKGSTNRVWTVRLVMSSAARQ